MNTTIQRCSGEVKQTHNFPQTATGRTVEKL